MQRKKRELLSNVDRGCPGFDGAIEHLRACKGTMFAFKNDMEKIVDKNDNVIPLFGRKTAQPSLRLAA